MRDWLFLWPSCPNWDSLVRHLETELEGHPDAAAISDDEAEQFAAAAWGLMNTAADALNVFCRAVGVPPHPITEKGRRRAILSLLRAWPSRRGRDILMKLPIVLGIGPVPMIGETPERISGEMLADAWANGMCLAWINQVMRCLGAEHQIPELMEKLHGSVLERRALVASGKLLIKRVIWQKQADMVAQAEQQTQQQRMLQRRFRQQESLLKAMESDVVQVAGRRDALRQAAREAQANARTLLAQARAEVAAAEAELQQRQTAQAGEMAGLTARFEERLRELSARLAALRTEQAAALRERGRSGVGPLAGLTFAVSGLEADPEGCRALIESAGGRIVRENAQVQIALGQAVGESGLAGLERAIRQQVLPQLLDLRAGRR